MTEQKQEIQDTAPWTIRQTTQGILFTLLPWLAFALSLYSLKSPSHIKLTTAMDIGNAIFTFILTLIVEGAFLIAPLFFALRIYHNNEHRWKAALQALGFRKFNTGKTFFWIVILLGAILGADYLYQLVITTLHLSLQTNDQVLLAHAKDAPISTYATLLAAVLIAPFCEEVFFRGFVFPGLLQVMSPVWAMILSAFLFALSHTDIGSFAVLFIIGIALAFLRLQSKSIWPGILLHTLNNGLAALSLISLMQQPH